MDTRLPSPSGDPKDPRSSLGGKPSVNSAVQDLVTMSRDILRENVQLQLLLTQYAEGILESTLRKVEQFSLDHSSASEIEVYNTRPSESRGPPPRSQNTSQNTYARPPPLSHAHAPPATGGYNMHPSGPRAKVPPAQNMYGRTPSFPNAHAPPPADGYGAPGPRLIPAVQTTHEWGFTMHSGYSSQSYMSGRNAGFDHTNAPSQPQRDNMYTYRPSPESAWRTNAQPPMTARSASSPSKAISYRRNDTENASVVSSVFGWIRERMKSPNQIDIPSYLHN